MFFYLNTFNSLQVILKQIICLWPSLKIFSQTLEWLCDLQDMMSAISSHRCNWSLGFQEHLINGRFKKIPFPGYSGTYPPSRGLEKLVFLHGQCIAHRDHRSVKKFRPALSSMVDDGMDPDDPQDGNNEKESPKGDTGGVC